jgi:hypothetical protein
MELIHKTIAGERWESVEIKIRHTDNSVKTVLWNSATLYDRDTVTPIATIAEFGQRISAAAGKSTNIEFFPLMDKLGGNGPIMANALLAAGTRVTYIGALGRPSIHPVFLSFAQQAEVVSLCDPATTTAVEFGDGKLMLGQLRSLDTITLQTIDEVMGAQRFRDTLAAADLISLVNWTMIPNMTAVLQALVEKVLPELPTPAGNPQRILFFDLADPEKRSREDLLEVLALISRFGVFGKVTLGLNLIADRFVRLEVRTPSDGDAAPLSHTFAVDPAELITHLNLDKPLARPVARSTSCRSWFRISRFCDQPRLVLTRTPPTS